MRDPYEGDEFIKMLSEHMTEVDRRDHERLRRATSSMWRNFWITRAHKHGYPNTQIAKAFGLAESSVRAILKLKEGK